MARAVEQHKTKPAKRTSRRGTSRQSGRGSQNNPQKTEPSPWLLIDDVFARWRDRLGSSQEAVDELYALLCDRESRSASWRVDASGEEILGTRGVVNTGFWPDHPCLSVVPDVDGVSDRLGIDYTPYVDVYSLPGERIEFFVRRVDVERWQRLYFSMTPAPPPRATKGPVRGEIDRFGDADRALFPEIKRLMRSQHLTITEALRQIPENKLAGRGTLDSRIRRVSIRFRREKL